MIINQDSKLGCTSIENGCSVTTVDYLAIVDYSAIVDYPQITTAKMKGNVPQCGLIEDIVKGLTEYCKPVTDETDQIDLCPLL